MKQRIQLAAAIAVIVATGATVVTAAPHKHQAVTKEQPLMQTSPSEDQAQLPAEAAMLVQTESKASMPIPTIEKAAPEESANQADTPQPKPVTPRPAMATGPVYIGNNTYVAPNSGNATFTFGEN